MVLERDCLTLARHKCPTKNLNNNEKGKLPVTIHTAATAQCNTTTTTMAKKITQTVINGVEHNIPRFVSRVNNGWQVRVTPSKYFADSSHGGTAAALSAASAYRFSIIPQGVEDDVGSYSSSERGGKTDPTGIPGVYYRHNSDGSKRIEVRTNHKDSSMSYASQAVPKGGEEQALAWARKVREEHITTNGKKPFPLVGMARKLFGG